jgi:hypothetical protein
MVRNPATDTSMYSDGEVTKDLNVSVLRARRQQFNERDVALFRHLRVYLVSPDSEGYCERLIRFSERLNPQPGKARTGQSNSAYSDY